MAGDILKKAARKSILLKRLTRWHRSRFGGYPRWPRILKDDEARWKDLLRASAGGPKVLIATSVGAYLPGAILESLLSVALTARGAEVHALLCDEALPACLECTLDWFPRGETFAREGPRRLLCAACHRPADAMYRSLGIVVHRYGDFLTEEDRRRAAEIAASVPFREIKGYVHHGMAVGEHALAGALRFYARGELESTPAAERILRRYFEAALLTSFAAEAMFRRIRYRVALFHHGIYVPQGLIGEAARKAGVRVVNWNVAYKKGCFIFSHGDTYHRTLMDEPVEKWESMTWGPAQESAVDAYLKSRWKGTEDWIWFHERPREDAGEIVRTLGIDPAKPVIGLLTNVIWDAQLHYPANAFPTMMDWIVKTIAWFAKRDDLQLVIRVHPAEIRGAIPSRQRVVDEIAKIFPTLPRNIIVIPPESRISTYAAMALCNAVIIYGTKTGVELTSVGIPTIVAGEAWIRNKGLTTDAESEKHYHEILDRLPFRGRLEPDVVRRAKKYAYHFFFRRMIRIDAVEATGAWPPFQVKANGLRGLAPGGDAALDVVCEGILNGTDFIDRAEARDREVVAPHD